MKLWVDDIRNPPNDEWKWIKNSQEFAAYEVLGQICSGMIEEISFDHDLGEESSSNGYQLLCLIEKLLATKMMPAENIPEEQLKVLEIKVDSLVADVK